MNGGPIFVGGLAFSGKTPLRIALAAHPRIAMTRHTAMWGRFANRYGDLGRGSNLERCLDAMLADDAVARLHPDRDRILRDFRQGAPTYARLFALFHEHHAQRLGKARWGDQMKMLESYADEVLTAYPSAQMIQMVRDPRARHTAAASHHGQLPGRLGWETARWLYSANLARRNLRRYPGRYRVVRYEALAVEPEQTLRQLAGFLGEDYHPAMVEALADWSFDERDETASATLGGTAKQAAASAFVERYAGPQLRALEYPVTPRGRWPDLRPSFYVVDWPCNRAGLAMWQTLSQRRLLQERMSKA